MTRLIRTELLKLKTMRLTYGLLALAVALTALFSFLENNQAGASGTGVPPISTPDGLRTVTTVTGFAMLIAAVLGSIVANGEFRHSTATTSPSPRAPWPATSAGRSWAPPCSPHSASASARWSARSSPP